MCARQPIPAQPTRHAKGDRVTRATIASPRPEPPSPPPPPMSSGVPTTSTHPASPSYGTPRFHRYWTGLVEEKEDELPPPPRSAALEATTVAVLVAEGAWGCCRALARLNPAGVAVTADADGAARAAAPPVLTLSSRSNDRTKALSLAKYSLWGRVASRRSTIQSVRKKKVKYFKGVFGRVWVSLVRHAYLW